MNSAKGGECIVNSDKSEKENTIKILKYSIVIKVVWFKICMRENFKYNAEDIISYYILFYIEFT